MTVTASTSDFDLDAKYRVTDGSVLITGVQALARVLLDQIRADRERGLRTAAFVSGYPGSPLGGFDQTLATQRRRCWPSMTCAGSRE